MDIPFRKDEIDAHLATSPARSTTIFQQQTITKPTERKISRPTHETHYRNDHPNIGIALIFNHVVIPSMKPRDGTELDLDRITDAFNLYGFDIRVYEDKKHSEIGDILQEVAEEDHSENDCLVVVVMTHGMPDHVYAADVPYPVQNLMTPFLGENCKSLINKPKLFFIQACRGNKADPGAVYLDSNVPSQMRRFSACDEIDSAVSFTIPSTADTVLFYATYEGHVAFRNPEQGSWFIQSVAHMFEEHAEDGEVSLLDLLTRIVGRVAYNYQSNSDSVTFDQMKSMPNFVSSLTKIFKIKPKPKINNIILNSNHFS